jgi:hypothetical protein
MFWKQWANIVEPPFFLTIFYFPGTKGNEISFTLSAVFSICRCPYKITISISMISDALYLDEFQALGYALNKVVKIDVHIVSFNLSSIFIYVGNRRGGHPLKRRGVTFSRLSRG